MLHLYCVKLKSEIMNVTISIDEHELKQARIIALQENTSLNAVIRDYLKIYIGKNSQSKKTTEQILHIAEQSQFSSQNKKLTREELYER